MKARIDETKAGEIITQVRAFLMKPHEGYVVQYAANVEKKKASKNPFTMFKDASKHSDDMVQLTGILTGRAGTAFSTVEGLINVKYPNEGIFKARDILRDSKPDDHIYLRALVHAYTAAPVLDALHVVLTDQNPGRKKQNLEHLLRVCIDQYGVEGKHWKQGADIMGSLQDLIQQQLDDIDNPKVEKIEAVHEKAAAKLAAVKEKWDGLRLHQNAPVVVIPEIDDTHTAEIWLDIYSEMERCLDDIERAIQGRPISKSRSVADYFTYFKDSIPIIAPQGEPDAHEHDQTQCSGEAKGPG